MSTLAPTPLPLASPRFRSIALLAGRRVLETIAVLAVPTTISALALYRPAQPAMVFWFHYSPVRFLQGRVWTIVTSALLPPKLDRLGLSTTVMTAILVPYVLVRGAWRAIGRFFAGHIVSTLAVAAIVLPGAALGWRFADTVAHTPDYGVSAGLAAVAGAMAVVVWRRLGPVAGAALASGIIGFFVYRVTQDSSLSLGLAEFEHFIAIAVGAVVELRAR